MGEEYPMEEGIPEGEPVDQEVLGPEEGESFAEGEELPEGEEVEKLPSGEEKKDEDDLFEPI